MKIIDQSKKLMIDTNAFYIFVKSLDGDTFHGVFAKPNASELNTNTYDSFSLGRYESEDDALKEFQKIVSAESVGANLFNMK
jgi:hypothetical protein